MTAQLITHDLAPSFIQDELVVRKMVDTMITTAKELVVNSDYSFKQATAIWKQAREWKKTIETQRKAMIEPQRKFITQINDRAKEITEPLDHIEEHIKTKIDRYHKDLEAQREAFIAQQKEAADMLGVDSTDIYVPEVASSMRGSGAIAYKKTKKTIKVTDIKKVPEKYLMINEKLIEEDLKAGGADIPGIEIVEEETIQLRSR